MVPVCPLTIKDYIKNAVDGASEHRVKTGNMTPFSIGTLAADRLLASGDVVCCLSCQHRVERGANCQIHSL